MANTIFNNHKQLKTQLIKSSRKLFNQAVCNFYLDNFYLPKIKINRLLNINFQE